MTDSNTVQPGLATLGASGWAVIERPLDQQALSGRLSCVLLGDSITADNGGPGSSGQTAGFANYGYFTWANAIMGGRFDVLNNAGVAGDTVAQMLARIGSGVLAYNPGYCFILAGTNDIAVQATPVETIIATYKQIIDRCCDAGIVCVCLAILPRTTIGSAQELLDKARVNRWLWKYATQRNGIHFINSHVDLAVRGTGLPVSGMLRDGTHLAPMGAFTAGKAVANSLKSSLPARDWYNDDLTDTYNLINADLSAAGDVTSNLTVTSIAGFTGTLAANWAAARPTGGAGTTAVFNDQAVGSDGAADWQEIQVTACDTAGAVIAINKAVNITAGFSVGDLIEGAIELDLVSCVAIRSINFQIAMAGGVATNLEVMQEFNQSDGVTVPAAQGFRGVLRTPRLAVVSGTTSFAIKIRIVCHTTSAIATARYRRPMCRNITAGGY